MFECVKQAFATFGGMLSQVTPALKCNSNCCTNIKVYDPKGCCFNGEISNRWIRATTPSVESPKSKKRFFSSTTKDEAFFTPKG